MTSWPPKSIEGSEKNPSPKMQPWASLEMATCIQASDCSLLLSFSSPPCNVGVDEALGIVRWPASRILTTVDTSLLECACLASVNCLPDKLLSTMSSCVLFFSLSYLSLPWFWFSLSPLFALLHT